MVLPKATPRRSPVPEKPLRVAMNFIPRDEGLVLYSANTVNGQKTHIFLEELRAAYDIKYMYRAMKLQQGEHKQEWYLKINANGRIPALVDHLNDGFKVFETAAILLYLASRYDKARKFSFEAGSNNESEALQWTFFFHGGVGPMQGQAMHYLRAAEKIQYSIDRYVNETKRLYSVLNTRLQDRHYLAGPGNGTYSIADINCFPHINGHSMGGIDSLDEWPGLKAWHARIADRAQVQSGLDISPSS